MAQTLKIALPAQTAAGATSVTEIGLTSTVNEEDFQLNRAVLIAPSGYSTIAHNATNYVTFNIQRVRAAGTPVVLATFNTTAVDIVAETPIAFTLSGTAAQESDIQRDDNYECQMVQSGAGVAVGAGLMLEVEFS